MKKYFVTTDDINMLRSQYRELAKKYHPDLNPEIDENIMKQINAEYEQLLQDIKTPAGKNYSMDNETAWQEKFVQTLKLFASINGIFVEMIGNWIWISGETKPIKEKIKELGFKFSGKKLAWYWKNYTYFKLTNKKFQLDELRDIYGSRQIEGNSAINNNLLPE
jgi:DnaJ-class molecular chaperone